MSARTIGTLALLAVILLPGCVREAESQSVPAALALESTISLPGVNGRIDHLAIDMVHGRLFIAALENGSVEVVDLSTGRRIAQISDLHEPQGVEYLPDRNELVVASGDGAVRFYLADNFTLAGEIKLAADADNVRIDPTTGAVVIGYGNGALAIIDAASRSVKNTIALSAHPESFRIDPTGRRAFVNLPDARQIAVADLTTMKVEGAWRASHGANYPMLFDAASNSVLVAYRQAARLVITDAGDGKVRQDIDLCGDSDDLFLDPKRQRIYVSCGSGDLDVFAGSSNGYERIGRISTRSGARTSLFVPELDRLFVAARAADGKAAAILVFRPS